MRRTTTTILSTAVALGLTACSTPAAGPTETGTSTPSTAEPSGTPDDGVPVTDLPEDVLLPADLLGVVETPRQTDDGLRPWRLPEPCEIPAPEAFAMRTASQGTGEFEQPVGVHQVAVFSDVDAAVAAADDLGAALELCQEEGEETRYVAEDVDVGAQGKGLAADYYGVSAAEGDLDEALGSYLAVTRRGNAVTLVADEGGEGAIGAAREEIVARAAAAWGLLCAYDSEGC